MSDSERVFISYSIPARSPAAVRYLVHTFVFTVSAFVFAWNLIARNLPETSILGCVVLTLGIVLAVVSVALFMRYISNQDELIRVTDQTITCDSKTWEWGQVLQIDLHRRSRHVNIHLNNGPARSRLTLLVQVPGDDAEVVMRELRSFVEAKGIPVRDRGA